MAETGQTTEGLREHFGMAGVLEFVERGELLCVEVRTPACRAVVALQGAHVVEWEPAEAGGPVLFVSGRSAFVTGKAIRGGVPVIWPWFGERSDAVGAAPAGGPPSGAHGFARTAVWSLDFAALAGEAMHLTLSLQPTEATEAVGFGRFRLVLQVVLGRELELRLTTANDGSEELRFEEALHSYFAVAEAERVEIGGLAGTEYLDKRDGMRRKREGDGALRLLGATDRVYLGTEAACAIEDVAGGRRILVEKFGSRSTVVWNPWSELTPGLKDMEPEGWHGMVCVETANVGEAAVRLAPGGVHVMECRVSVDGGAA